MMIDGTIIESVKDAIAVASTILESAEKEVSWLVPAPLLVLAAHFCLNDKSRVLIQKGGHVRGITQVSPPYIEVVSKLIDIGIGVRHVEQYSGAFMVVGDCRQSVSAIDVNVKDLSLDDKIVALWTENPDYAEYLLSSFDRTWVEATDAQKRIQELSDSPSHL
ncbi:MAG: hypothetical protein WAN56_03050 [Halobacteriota archaeon]